MEHIESTDSPAPQPRRVWIDATIALVTTVALSLAPLSYFLTACTSAIDVSERIEWMGLMAVIVPMAFPGYVALAAVAAFTLVFCALRSKRFSRIRRIVIPAALGAIVVGALLFGAVVPTRCSIF